MRRVVADFIKREDAPEDFDIDIFLENDRRYSPVLDLFNGESYYLKVVDREYESIGRNGTTIMRIDSKDGQIFIDKKPMIDILNRYIELTEYDGVGGRGFYLNLSYEDKQVMRYGVSIMMFMIRMYQDKEFIISDRENTNISTKPSMYKYNLNKVINISNVEYDKKDPQGRGYNKQADGWIVRTHYRVRNGIKYLVKGYKKSFK
ncbi:MAG: hypothetical protein ACRC7S_19445 [Cetobacterium sp.]